MRLARSALYAARIATLILGCAFFLCAPLGITAQESGLLPGETLDTNPKDREVKVTAIVPVQDPPPVPILIEPVNEALLNSGAVTFRWRLQAHVVGYTRQEIILNGQTLFANLPLGDAETAEYRLRFENGVYSLQLKEGQYLANGDYTWRVRVTDVNNRSTASTTWIFSIDSHAPQLLITQIDQHQTAISSHDATTVPDDPFIVRTRTPIVSGKTEASAQVQLTVVFPDGRTVLLSTPADSAGNFSFTLPTLERGERVELRFTSIDTAGNTSALSGIFVIYEPALLTFPLLPPFLLPEVPIVELPLDLPVIRIPELPVPPVLEEPIAQITTFWDITRDFLEEILPNLPWMSLIFFFLYLLLLFWLTGAGLKFFGNFATSFLRAWIMGWKRSSHVWKDQHTGKTLPGLGFEIHRTHESEKKLKKERLTTNLFGEWLVEERPGWVHALGLQNSKWLYPVNGRFSESWQGTRELWLHGESFTWKTPEKAWQTTAENFVLPTHFSEFRFVAWAQRRSQGGAALWLRFFPRVCLLLALLLAALVVLLAPNLLSLCWFVSVLWVMFRDIVWAVPEAWKVYLASSQQGKNA